MGVIVGLDVGRRRIGVAASDELGLTAQPVKVLTRTSREKDLDAVADLCRELEAQEVVVGMPYRLDGTMGPQAERVAAFARRLQERLDIPVITWDERLSTAAARQVLLEADASRRRRRQVIDKMAAAVILQGFLDHRRLGSQGSSPDLQAPQGC